MTQLVASKLQLTRDRVVWCDAELVIREERGRRHELAIAGVTSLAAFSDQLWTVADQTLTRWTLEGRSLGTTPCEGSRVLVPALAGTAAATWNGDRLWFDDLGTFRELRATDGDVIAPFAGRRTISVGRSRARLGSVTWGIPLGCQVVASGALFDGAGVLLVVARGVVRELWVANKAGALQHRIAIPRGELRVASRRGLAIIHDQDRELVVFDLRFGRAVGTGQAIGADVELAIDTDGVRVAVLANGAVRTMELREVLTAARVVAVAAEPEPEVVVDATELLVTEQPIVVAAVEPFARPLALEALSPRRVPVTCSREQAIALLERELELVAAWTLSAIAHGWDTRRIGYANESAHPHEHEVAALLGRNVGFASEHVAAAKAGLEHHETQLANDPSRRALDTPLGALAAELGLSVLAIEILLVVAAPTVWGDAARLYGILGNDPGRPIVDELLVHQVLGSRVNRHDIARELDPRAPLVWHGAIAVSGKRPFAELTIDPVVVARLRAEPNDLGSAVTLREGELALEQICVPRGVVAAALEALAMAGRAGRAARIAIHGKRGAGRRTLLATVAREAHRSLGLVDASLLPAAPELFASALRATLRRIHLAGYLPVICGLDEISFGERAVADVVTETLRSHPAAIALVLGNESVAPLDAGHIAIMLRALDETERIARWRRALSTRDLWVRDLDGLAARYRVTPGLVERAVAAAASSSDGADASDAVELYVKQTRDARLGTVAKRVERLGSWSSLVLPPDIHDSVRELIARVRHRRTVFEQWGMNATMATSRGITAMFQGQPGTGKTLVAGVIARELGLDLYQVDLSKVMSKWIGETERNLATVFDAAEDGQVILLFDEADSLFAKRTEVRSSNDRYANLEVNYLLQRLDTFEGIAILTTNFGGSIDPAFRRRMSFRLSFPFPDEETRAELWRAHLPPQLPIGGELALDKLARKYQLAGGYIRNACLRAAFLAAQEETSLFQDHLERAVALEFAELGKLSGSGAID